MNVHEAINKLEELLEELLAQGFHMEQARLHNEVLVPLRSLRMGDREKFVYIFTYGTGKHSTHQLGWDIVLSKRDSQKAAYGVLDLYYKGDGYGYLRCYAFDELCSEGSGASEMFIQGNGAYTHTIIKGLYAGWSTDARGGIAIGL